MFPAGSAGPGSEPPSRSMRDARGMLDARPHTVGPAVFLYSEALGVPPFVSPLLLLLIMLGFLFNPTRTLRHEARFWMIRIMVTGGLDGPKGHA